MRLYGQRPRVELNAPDLRKDQRELRITRAALEASLPMVGVCRGAQLMNVALGGSLYQDVQADGVTRRSHMNTRHAVDTRPGTLARRVIGRRSEIPSEHHQAVDRLGSGLVGSARSDDSVHESLELRSGHFAIGLQWHPEDPDSGEAGRRMGEALVDAALGASR